MLRIDLHTHSTHSDGILSESGLVSLARGRRVSVLSLTDHDTVSGVPGFLSSCGKNKIKGVPGIELSAKYQGSLHILGYRFDHERLGASALLKEIRDGRAERNAAVCEKLRSAGVDISLDELSQGGASDVVARPHFARALVRKGYASSLNGAFTKYLMKGTPGYVPRFRASPENCISLIRDSGGLPVLAHPWQIGLDMFDLKKLAADLKGFGLWGVECYSSSSRAAGVYEISKLAGELGLYVTAGSDFHGDTRHDGSIGVPVPDDILPWARLCGGRGE